MSIALEDLATSLSHALTPSNIRPTDSEVKLTSLAFGQGVSHEVIEKYSLPKETEETVGMLFAAALFTNSLCFGIPKTNHEGCPITQITYSASALVFYFNNLDYFVGIIPDFITHFVQTTMDHIQGKVSEEVFSQTAYSFIEFIAIAHVLVAGADLETPLVPPEFEIPLLKPHIDSLTQNIIKCIQTSDQLRAAHSVGQPTQVQEAALAQLLQELNASIPQYHQLFTLLQAKVRDHFEVMFNEPAYVDWQNYCYSFASSISNIIMISFKVATYGPETFVTMVMVLQQFANLAFQTISPFMTLIRFRGKFDEFVRESKIAHEKMGSIFVPLVQAILNIMPKCPVPFQNSIESQLVPLINEMRQLHSDYDAQVEKLISAMKTDRRFSVFQNVGMGENSELTEAAKGSIDITTKIATQLIKGNSGVAEITESLQKLTGEFDSFSKVLVQFIECETDPVLKIRLVHHREGINDALNQFVQGFGTFAQASDNIAFRHQTGIYASNLLLSLCSIDYHPIVLKNLASIRQVLQENVTQFVPANMKTLIDLLTLFYSRKDAFSQDVWEMFVGIFSIIISQIRESSLEFQANANSNNPTNVIQCIRECDKLQALLSVLYEAFKLGQVADDVQPAIKLLEIFTFDIRYSAETLRLALQLNFTHALKTFVSYLEPFVETVGGIATLQADEYYERFKTLKTQLLDSIKSIREATEKAPPHGVYAQSFLLSLVEVSRNSFVPTVTLIRECQEILKLATAPAQVKTMMNNISQILNTLNQLNPYVNAVYYEHKLILPSLLGLLLNRSCNTTDTLVDGLITAVNSNPEGASAAGTALVHSLYELTDTMDYLEQLNPVANQIREIANAVSVVTGFISQGDSTEVSQLLALLANIKSLTSGLKQVITRYIEDVQKFGKQAAEATKGLGGAPGLPGFPGASGQPDQQQQQQQQQQSQQQNNQNVTDPNVPIFPAGPGILVNPATRERYENLLIDRIPLADVIDQLFMNAISSGNEQMKGILTSLVNAIKKDVDEFNPLFAQYQRDPTNAEILARLNALGSRINANINAYQDCLNFNPETSTLEHLKELLSNFLSLPSTASKGRAAPELLLSISAYADKVLEDNAKGHFAAAVNEVSAKLGKEPELAHQMLEILARSLTENLQDIAQVFVDAIKDSIAKNDLQSVDTEIQKSLLVDRLLKIIAGFSNPMPQAGSVQQKLADFSVHIKGTNEFTQEDRQIIDDLISQLEEIMNGGSADVLPEDPNEITDRVMDQSALVNQLGATILADLKKATAADMPSILKNFATFKATSLDIANTAILLAAQRQDIPAEDNEDFQSEIAKLLENLKLYEDSVNSVTKSANQNAAVRAVGKVNRDITMNLSRISELIDNFVEIPTSFLEPNQDDFQTHSNLLLCDFMKFARLADATDKSSASFAPKFNKAVNMLKLNLQKFKGAVSTASHGVDEAEDFSEMLGKLDHLLNDMLEPTKLNYETPKSGCVLVSEIRQAVSTALNQEIVADQKAVASLPFRYSVAASSAQPSSTTEVLPLVISSSTKATNALKDLSSALNNAKTSSDAVTAQLKAFHAAITDLIQPTDQMSASTWNPQCQSQLQQGRQMLVQAGDLAIDATRARLLGNEGWRENVNAFINNAVESINRCVAASKSAADAAQADLAVTNEAERELVNAARSVQASQQRLSSMKQVALQKKVTSGEGYIGCDIIEISGPILNTAAKLIETAQAQTKFLLSRDPTLPNQRGLIHSANDLVESLTLITVAAESTVNSEEDGIARVLAASNLVSSGVAHFLAEVNQKNGSPQLNEAMKKITDSIQGLVKQLRSFGETAQEAKTQKQTDAVQTGKKPLSSMIEKLNAEAKVVEARRALEEAEMKLKKTRAQKQ